MNTTELHQLLTQEPITQPYIGDVCALDQLPRKVTRRPKLYIVNSQPKHRPGKHWLVLYFPRVGPAEFFDSLGHGPRYYSWRLERYLKKQGGYYIRNQRRVQQVGTKACGHFCYYYAYQRCVGRSMRQILRDFHHTRLTINEKLVTEFAEDKEMNDLADLMQDLGLD